MGIFDKFKRSKKEDTANQKPKPQLDEGWKMILVDQIYLLDVPSDWDQFASDRFRMKNASETIQFSATNYGKALSEANGFAIEDLKTECEYLFEKFVNEGDYEPINDRIIGEKFVYQAFKVDEETQYYFYTFREALGNLIRINFIVREMKPYNAATKDSLLKIGESIAIKVA